MPVFPECWLVFVAWSAEGQQDSAVGRPFAAALCLAQTTPVQHISKICIQNPIVSIKEVSFTDHIL